MNSTRGSTRLLLVGVLAAAAILLVVSAALIVSGDGGPGGYGDGEESGAGPRMLPDAGARVRVGDGDPDDEWEDETDGEDIIDWGTRTPHGQIFVVDDDSLRKVLELREWDEIRRQIVKLQENGGEVPADVLEALLGFLEGEDTRIDAMLALGHVKSDAAGEALAQLASDTSWPLAVRNAALDAIEKNGSPAALLFVKTLVINPATDPALLRHAYRALAGIGGAEATRTLVDALRAHSNDDVTGALVTALGKARGSDETLAQTLRIARDTRDTDLARLVVKVGLIHAADAGDAMRSEIRRLLEDPSALEFVEDDEARLRLKGGALSAASAMGGELLDPVVRIARDDADGLRAIALYSLRQARGDGAAATLTELLEAPSMTAHGREILEALGQTGSFKATDALLRKLASGDQNERQAASRGLALVRDPASVKPILERLEQAGDHHAIAKNLIEALGTIGANDALPQLQRLLESEEQHALDLRPWVSRAISRIKHGNPDSTRME